MPKSTAHPHISLGLPVYNGQRYLAGAIERLLGQSFSDFELIICDNASTDDSEAICRDFAAKDARVRYVRNNTNIGAAPNFNKTFELSRGQYFKWVAHDDLHEPTYLERAVEVLDAKPGVSLVHCEVGIIDEEGRRCASLRGAHGEALTDPARLLADAQATRRLTDLLLKTHWCFEIFGLMRRDLALLTPLHAPFYGGDKVMLAYMCLLGRFEQIPETLFYRRYHAGSSTSIKSAADREKWIGAKTGKAVFPRLKCFAGYAAAIGASPLSLGEKLACYGVLSKYVLQVQKWKKMLGMGSTAK